MTDGPDLAPPGPLSPPAPAPAPPAPAPPAPKGLHPLWSAVIFLLLWLGAQLAGGLPVLVWLVLHPEQFAEVAASPTEWTGRHAELTLLGSAVAAVPTFGVIVLCRRMFDRKRVVDLGLAWTSRASLRQGALGFAAGALSVLAVLATLVLTGDLHVAGLAAAPTPLSALKVLGLLATFAVQSGTEELVCRGYLLHTLLAIWRPRWAVAAVSLLFGLLHTFNPDASIISVAQTVLIGVVFAQVTLRTQTLWAAIGLHTAWNFTLGTIASLPVSGLTVFHLLDVATAGNSRMTGGGYGPEASPVTLALVAAAAIVLALLPTRQSDVPTVI